MRGHITKRGKDRNGKDKYYVVVDIGVDEHGKRKQKWLSGFRTKAEAERALTKVLGEIGAGQYVDPQRIPLGSYLLDEWLPARAAQIRPTTSESYRDLITRHVLPSLGRVPLARLTPVHLNKFYGELLANGRTYGSGGLSARTVRLVHSALRKALADAVRWRYLAVNPADGASPPSESAAKAPEMKTWTATELGRFLELTREDPLYIGWHLAACCGMRRGEACGLRWGDVYLDEKLPRLVVRQQLVECGPQILVSPPKSAKGNRVIVLDSETVAALRRHRRRQAANRLATGPDYADGDLVLAQATGKPVHPSALARRFLRQVLDHDLPRIRFHDLRHTHATLALAAGIHPKIVSERLGHASTSLTLDVYSHATPSLQHQAAQLFGSLLTASPPDSN